VVLLVQQRLAEDVVRGLRQVEALRGRHGGGRLPDGQHAGRTGGQQRRAARLEHAAP
jgi:hypothetical protein